MQTTTRMIQSNLNSFYNFTIKQDEIMLNVILVEGVCFEFKPSRN